MTEKEAALASWARSRIGDGYVYGATGWICTEKHLNQQAEQYPEYASKILSICVKWIGKRCYDCAQLSRKGLAALGINIPSGATSQWRSDSWVEKGEIGALPAGRVACLFRQSGDRMNHTGLYIGDGMVVDARGSQYGVVLSSVHDYPWTHYAIPNGLGGKEIDETMDTTGIGEYAVVTTASGDLNFRVAPGKTSAKVPGCAKIPRGQFVELAADVCDGWVQVIFDGHIGFVDASFLTPVVGLPVDDGDDDIDIAPEIVNIRHKITVLATGETIYIDGDFEISVDVQAQTASGGTDKT